jgi:hypothetical protein
MKVADRKALIASINGWPKESDFGQRECAIVLLAHGPTRPMKRSVKPLPGPLNAGILVPMVITRRDLIEFAPNGSLTDHVSSGHWA